jgi:hypothetical protein
MDIDINVAQVLRDIAANSDQLTGKILKKAEKAARKSLSYITYPVSYNEYINVRHQDWSDYIPTPMVEKLLSLGFTISDARDTNFWGINLIKISW